MIEELIRNYLNNKLNVPIYLEVPESIPDSYVLIELIDAGRTNQIDAATFTFTCREKSLYNAALLADEVEHALEDSIELEEISSAKLGGKRPDIDNAHYQYVITFNFFYFREEI